MRFDILIYAVLCHRSLKEAFFHQLINSSLRCDLQLRNDLLAITTFVAENSKSLLVVSLRWFIGSVVSHSDVFWV